MLAFNPGIPGPHTHTSSILLTFCVPIATYFISIWREVNCHKQLVARRPHPCRYCCPCRCRCWYWCPSPRLAAISHALSLLLAMFIIYLQYFLIQNEAASLSELLMARQYTTAKCWEGGVTPFFCPSVTFFFIFVSFHWQLLFQEFFKWVEGGKKTQPKVHSTQFTKIFFLFLHYFFIFFWFFFERGSRSQRLLTFKLCIGPKEGKGAKI